MSRTATAESFVRTQASDVLPDTHLPDAPGGPDNPNAQASHERDDRGPLELAVAAAVALALWCASLTPQARLIELGAAGLPGDALSTAWSAALTVGIATIAAAALAQLALHGAHDRLQRRVVGLRTTAALAAGVVASWMITVNHLGDRIGEAGLLEVLRVDATATVRLIESSVPPLEVTQELTTMLVVLSGVGAALTVTALCANQLWWWAIPLGVWLGISLVDDVATNDIGTWGIAPLLVVTAVVLVMASKSPRGFADGLARPRIPDPATAAIGVAIAIGAATLTPTTAQLVPGNDAEPWLDVRRGSTGGGAVGYEPIVDVSSRLGLPSPVELLRVQTTRPAYLRLAALTEFDGTTWTLSDAARNPTSDDTIEAGDQIPLETEAVDRRFISASVDVLGLRNIYVPAPQRVTRVTSPTVGDLVFVPAGGYVAATEVETITEGGREVSVITPGLSYDVQAAEPVVDVEAARLAPQVDDPALVALPRNFPALRREAERVYRDEGASTAIDKAFALQSYFAAPGSDYTYSLDVAPLRGSQALEDFVLRDRVGYCEYYATAMAVMLRETGVASRVAVGFLPGTQIGYTSGEFGEARTEWVVTSDDAHAWVEVLIPGHGWLRFDPTPRDDGATIPPTPNNFSTLTPLRERDGFEPAPGDARDGNPTLPELDLPDFDFPIPELPDNPNSPDAPSNQDAPGGTPGVGEPGAPSAAPDGQSGQATAPSIEPSTRTALIVAVLLVLAALWALACVTLRTSATGDRGVALAMRELLLHARFAGLAGPPGSTARSRAQLWATACVDPAADDAAVQQSTLKHWARDITASRYAPRRVASENLAARTHDVRQIIASSGLRGRIANSMAALCRPILFLQMHAHEWKLRTHGTARDRTRVVFERHRKDDRG